MRKNLLNFLVTAILLVAMVFNTGLTALADTDIGPDVSEAAVGEDTTDVTQPDESSEPEADETQTDEVSDPAAEPEAPVNEVDDYPADEDTAQEDTAQEVTPVGVSYDIYTEAGGWLVTRRDGEVSGNEEEFESILGLKLQLENLPEGVSGGITYEINGVDAGDGKEHLEASDGEAVGPLAVDWKIESLKLKLTGDMEGQYDISYRVYAEGFGWLDWTSNGTLTGTEGFHYGISALQVKLAAKGIRALMAGENVYIINQTPEIQYEAHIQSIGWQEKKKDGQTAGTTGQSKRMEALKIQVANASVEGGVRYSSHVQGIGWQDYVADGELSGTTGQYRRMEALKIELTGELANHYDIYYRVHSANIGWLDWAKNGEIAGTTGYYYRMEAIEIVLVTKDGAAPGETDRAALIFTDTVLSYQSHLAYIGWESEMATSGQTSGTTGQSRRMEALKIEVNSPLSGSIEYRSHVQNIGWQSYVADGKESGTTGQSKRVEAVQIRLTGELANVYDVYYRVHSADYGWLGWTKNDAMAGTSGMSLRMEAIQITLVSKGTTGPSDDKSSYETKKKHMIVAGHGWNGTAYDNGAYNSSLKLGEHQFVTRELWPYLKKYAAKLNKNEIIFYDTGKNMYAETKKGGGAYSVSTEVASVTELHLDSGSSTATGGHVIVRPGNRTSQNLALVSMLRNNVGVWAGVSSTEGLSYRTGLLNCNVFAGRGINYRLIELGFISNSSDVSKLRRNLDRVAKEMIIAITGETVN